MRRPHGRVRRTSARTPAGHRPAQISGVGHTTRTCLRGGSRLPSGRGRATRAGPGSVRRPPNWRLKTRRSDRSLHRKEIPLWGDPRPSRIHLKQRSPICRPSVVGRASRVNRTGRSMRNTGAKLVNHVVDEACLKLRKGLGGFTAIRCRSRKLKPCRREISTCACTNDATRDSQRPLAVTSGCGRRVNGRRSRGRGGVSDDVELPTLLERARGFDQAVRRLQTAARRGASSLIDFSASRRRPRMFVRFASSSLSLTPSSTVWKRKCPMSAPSSSSSW
jgi:hypothetical protein